MRIASFNLENLSGKPSDEDAVRQSVLRPQFERLNADILCLQEVDAWRESGSALRSHAVLDALLKGTPYAGFFRAGTVSSSGEEPRDRHNLIVLSRWPIDKVEQFANDLVPAPHYRCVTASLGEAMAPVTWDRPILSACITLPNGASLYIINLHLKAPLAAFIEGQKIGPFAWKSVSGWAEGFYLASMKQAGQALEARIAIERVFDEVPEAFIVVCGDFNAEERETPFRILLGDTEDTGNGRLVGRELVALENTLPDYRRFTVIHAGHKLMLDHILVSRPLLAHYRSMEVHNEALGDELIAHTLMEKTPESYHAPIVAEFHFEMNDMSGSETL